MPVLPFSLPGRAIAAVTGLAAVAATVLATASPAVADTTDDYSVNPSGTVAFVVKGLGHGHGMSQYGALGAADQGLLAGQILRFYYPNTNLVTYGTTWIRVALGGTGRSLSVAPADGLQVNGVRQRLPLHGVSAYRLVADGSGVQLQEQPTGGAWRVLVPRALPSGTAFQRPRGGVVTVLRTDGTTIAYRDNVRGVRVGSGVSAVNYTTLDHYVMGVVPREVPASWPGAAVRAQAVAARSYGRYAVLHPQGAGYDICDTSQCQVYGGATKRGPGGRIEYVDDAAAVAYYANTVLQYDGSVAFTQFSASNGGWMSDGGEPYLVAKRDPYDTAAHDPDFSYDRSIGSATLAQRVGLAHLTEIDLARDGQGRWGGRVVSATLKDSVDSSSTTISGSQLADDLGLGTTYFTVNALA